MRLLHRSSGRRDQRLTGGEREDLSVHQRDLHGKRRIAQRVDVHLQAAAGLREDVADRTAHGDLPGRTSRSVVGLARPPGG